MRRQLILLLAILPLGACNSSSSSPGGGNDAGPVNYDFTGLHNVLFGGSWQTDGVVVTVGGQVVYEEYANGYSASTRHITYSASKSIGSALIGLAIDQGRMSLPDSVCKYISKPPTADPTLCDTTIEHLLHMSSGLKWSEDYGSDPTTSNVLEMLYGNESDTGAYAASRWKTARIRAPTCRNARAVSSPAVASTCSSPAPMKTRRRW